MRHVCHISNAAETNVQNAAFERLFAVASRARDPYLLSVLVRLTALLGVLLALSGCSSADRAETAFPNGTSAHTMAFGGLDRTYRVYKRRA